MRLPRLVRRLIDGWIALQVELQGCYSTERVRRLYDYTHKTSWQRVFSVCLLTPVPCLALVILTDTIPLADPLAGTYKNYVYWCRDYVSIIFISVTVLEQFRGCLTWLPLDNRAMVGTALFATTSATLFQFVCSILIGFPLPFSLVLAAIPWTPSILAPIFLLSRRLFQQDRQLLKDLLNYIIVFLCQISITLIYPAYMYVFTSLDGNSQTAFFILLPLIKILTKNWISRFLPGLNDMKPEVVIFNIEIFHSLYVSSALQTATSNLTTVLILLVDLGLLWISVADVNTLLSEVKMIVSRKLSEATASNSLTKTADVPYLDLCMLLLDDTGVKVDPRVSTAAISTPVELNRSPTNRKILVGPVVSDVAGAYQPETQPSSDQKPQTTTERHNLPPTNSGGMAQSLRDRMTHDEKVSFVLKMSQVLFVCEFVVLIEFTEVIVPVMYSIYIAAMSHLVNRVYYPQLANMSEEHLYSTIGNVLAYSSLELVSFLLITLLFKRKLNMSTFHQLAFVLDKQWSMVQSKLILWTFYVIQSSLFHFGVDFSLKFAWHNHNK